MANLHSRLAIAVSQRKDSSLLATSDPISEETPLSSRQTCCKIHAAPGMENVISKRCTMEGCVKRPVFGWEKQKPSKCKAHAEPGMKDVTHVLCEGDNCSRRPSFGHPGATRPSRCKVFLVFVACHHVRGPLRV
jgi:hypothetical protein